MKLERHYYKCHDCLEPVALEVEVGLHRGYHAPLCDCGGRLEHMGKVTGTTYTLVQNRCECDARCTAALGPNCDCHCGGVNHGTNRVVQTVIAHGQISLAPRTDLALRKQRVDEFGIAVATVVRAMPAAWSTAWEAKNRGEWIPNWSAFLAAQDYFAKIRKATQMKTHAGRMKALRKLIEPEKQAA